MEETPMAAKMERRQNWPMIPDVFDWLESGLPAMPGLRTSGGSHALRIEERMEGDDYLLRVELPGVDPDRDVDISVDGDLLTVRAERSERSGDKHRTEFHYGSLTRSVTLPPGARAVDAEAGYDQGILTVRVPIEEAHSTARKIPVTHDGGGEHTS
jgi:HSP20 family molecular chaperone IbpA